MDVETARTVLYAITAAGAMAWLTAVRFLRVSFTPQRERRDQPDDPMEMLRSASPGAIAGSVEVEGSPPELAAKAAAVVAEKSGEVIGPLKIVQSGADRLVVEGVGEAAGPQAAARFLRRGELRFRDARGGRTSIDYQIEVSAGRGLLIGGTIFLFLGLAALVVGFMLIHTYVVPNPNSAVRGQTLQMLQVVHFLWPPFLFGGLYRRGRSAVREAFEVMIHNLPYYG